MTFSAFNGNYGQGRPDYEFLEAELQEQRERANREAEARRREHDQRIADMEEERNRQLRSAKTWPEALRKQQRLYAEELRAMMWGKPLYGKEAEERGLPADDFFGPGIEACKRALEIWQEKETAAAEQIKLLEEQIKAIREGIRLEVAGQLAAESESKPVGWVEVANAIKTEDPENWLDW